MKLTTCFRIALVVLCALALEMTAWAQSGSISDGNATFEFNGSAFTHGSADFSDGDVDGGSDNVFQNWWWYRITGENMETPFPSLVDGLGPDSENYAGDTATLDWNSSIPLFDATLSINIGDFGAGTPGAGVTETMVITNTSTLSYELNVFNYLDANVGGTAGGDSASLLPASAMAVFDDTDDAGLLFFGPGATTYRVEPFADLRDALLDGVADDFSDTGLPFGPGDFTGAYQWTMPLSPGETITLTEIISIQVPEPASLMLVSLACLALFARRFS